MGIYGRGYGMPPPMRMDTLRGVFQGYPRTVDKYFLRVIPLRVLSPVFNRLHCVVSHCESIGKDDDMTIDL